MRTREGSQVIAGKRGSEGGGRTARHDIARGRVARLAALSATAFAILTLLVWRGATTPFDTAAVTSATELSRSAGLIWIANLASGLASPLWLAAVAVAASALLGKGRRQRMGLLALQCVNLAGAAVIDLALKAMFARPRPSVALVAETGFSYPSGHSMLAMAAYGLLIVLVARRTRRGFGGDDRAGASARSLIAVLVAAIALVGTSRVLLGVHYPTDAVGGFVASLTWVLLVDLVLLERPTTWRKLLGARDVEGPHPRKASAGGGQHERRAPRAHVPSRSF